MLVFVAPPAVAAASVSARSAFFDLSSLQPLATVFLVSPSPPGLGRVPEQLAHDERRKKKKKRRK